MRKIGYILALLLVLFMIRHLAKPSPTTIESQQVQPATKIEAETPNIEVVEPTEDVLQENGKNELPVDIKKRLKKDLKTIEVTIDRSGFDKYRRHLAGQEIATNDGLLDDLVNELEKEKKEDFQSESSEVEAELKQELRH